MRLVTIEQIRAWRDRMRIKSESMGELMGLRSSAYIDLENGTTKVNARHHMCFERATLVIALERGNPEVAWPTIRQDAMRLAGLAITGLMPHMSNPPLATSVTLVATDCGSIDCVNRCDGDAGQDYAKCPHHRMVPKR